MYRARMITSILTTCKISQLLMPPRNRNHACPDARSEQTQNERTCKSRDDCCICQHRFNLQMSKHCPRSRPDFSHVCSCTHMLTSISVCACPIESTRDAQCAHHHLPKDRCVSEPKPPQKKDGEQNIQAHPISFADVHMAPSSRVCTVLA